jgi:hypothetical protein
VRDRKAGQQLHMTEKRASRLTFLDVGTSFLNEPLMRAATTLPHSMPKKICLFFEMRANNAGMAMN